MVVKICWKQISLASRALLGTLPPPPPLLLLVSSPALETRPPGKVDVSCLALPTILEMAEDTASSSVRMLSIEVRLLLSRGADSESFLFSPLFLGALAVVVADTVFLGLPTLAFFLAGMGGAAVPSLLSLRGMSLF